MLICVNLKEKHAYNDRLKITSVQNFGPWIFIGTVQHGDGTENARVYCSMRKKQVHYYFKNTSASVHDFIYFYLVVCNEYSILNIYTTYLTLIKKGHVF